jgi:tetratricopeptide (TPR) repeat protein
VEGGQGGQGLEGGKGGESEKGSEGSDGGKGGEECEVSACNTPERADDETPVVESEEQQEVHEKAEALKLQGTACFKLSKYEDACDKYENALAQLQKVTTGSSGSVAGMPAAAAQMQVALLLNLAQCHLKLGEPSRAIDRCTEVLGVAAGGGVSEGGVANAAPAAEGKDKVKALYRRASAYASSGVQKWALATDDLKEAFALSPEDRAIAKLMAKVNEGRQPNGSPR